MNLKRLAMACGLLLWTATATAQFDWVLYEHNPVIPGLEPGEWPENARWIEEVVLIDGTYHMFFTGTSEDFSVDHKIGHATSQDGITWTMDPINPVMSSEPEGGWDVTSYLALSVVHDGTEFLMWYGGMDPYGYIQVGLATSWDGSVWTRYPDNPVFETGMAGSFDGAMIFPSMVLRRNGFYQMWYAAFQTTNILTPSTIGHATSADGVTWDRRSEPVLEPDPDSDWENFQVFAPEVLFDGSVYHMWYTGASGFTGRIADVQIGYATSNDGVEWIRDPGNPLYFLGPSTEHPHVLMDHIGRKCEMYFNDTEGHVFSIDRATASCRARNPVRRVTGWRIPRPRP
jgi:sucrose-6-phosphate hydrolase SacC (GH32 family)